jgi:hypothetical protein
MSRKLFIGSSSEAIKFAQIVKKVLDSHFDVTIWDEKVFKSSVFKINQNYLTALLKASLEYDFGILIGSKDDLIQCRGSEFLQPRDNVLFELGLFTGRLGISKCAFLVENGAKTLSDLSGVTLANFETNDESSLIHATERIRELFLSNMDHEINFFPSTTLANVYFENYIYPTCKHIITKGGYLMNFKKYNTCEIKVIIPDRITEDINLQFEKLKKKFKTKNDKFHYEGRPRNITIETQVKNKKLVIIDFPTILSGINYAINQHLPTEFNKKDSDYMMILNRELVRFVATLDERIKANEFDKLVVIQKESEL